MAQTEIGFKITIPGIHSGSWLTVEVNDQGEMVFTSTRTTESGAFESSTSTTVHSTDARQLNRLMDIWAEQFP